jgi:hypothetical protein
MLFTLLWAPHCLAGTVVLFDEGHDQRFLIGQSGPLDLSKLAERFRGAGATVETTAQPLTAERLGGVDVLVVSGAFRPLKDTEIKAVAGFIEQGGSLAVLLHVGPIVGSLLHRLEVDFTNGTLHEPQQLLGDNDQDFRVLDLDDHPLFEGLQAFNVYGAWALRSTAPQAKVIARTSSKSWVDLNRDRRLTRGDAVQSFGVVVAGELGLGRYVVFGDDAIFQNRFLVGNNGHLAENLVRWLISQN